MVSREHIDSRRHMIPGRYLVAIFSRQPRDAFEVGRDVLAEQRPTGKRRQRSGDAESHGEVYEYVFWTIELEEAGVTNFKEGDVIMDGAMFVSVDEIKIELQGRRQRAYCSLSVDPADLADIE